MIVSPSTILLQPLVGIGRFHTSDLDFLRMVRGNVWPSSEVRFSPCCLFASWHVEKGKTKTMWLVPKTGGFSSAKPHLPLQLSKATHWLEESKVQRKAVWFAFGDDEMVVDEVAAASSLAKRRPTMAGRENGHIDIMWRSRVLMWWFPLPMVVLVWPSSGDNGL